MADTPQNEQDKKDDNVLFSFSLFGLPIEYTKADAAIDATILGVTTAATLGAGAPVAAGVAAVRSVGTQIVKGGFKAAAKAFARTGAKEGAEVAGKAGVEAATKTAGKGVAKELGEKLAQKADANAGQRIRNAINNKFEDSSWVTRNMFGKPLAATAGYARNHMFKTAVAADFGVNAVSQTINPDDPTKSVMYNAGSATVSDAASLAKGTGTVIAGAASLIPGVGEEVAEFITVKGPTAVKGFLTGAGDAVDGGMNGLSREAGIDPNTRIPFIPSGSKVFTLGKAAHNGRVSADQVENSGQQEQVADPATSQLDGNGISTPADAAGAFGAKAKEKLGSAAQSLDNLDIAIDPKDIDLQNPEAMWNKLKIAAKNNPILQKMVDIGDANPLVKYGMASGFGLGFLRGGLDGGSPAERAKLGFKKGLDNAIAFGIIAWIIGQFVPQHEAVKAIGGLANRGLNTVQQKLGEMAPDSTAEPAKVDLGVNPPRQRQPELAPSIS